MSRKIWAIVLGVGLVAVAGCTGVQKGTAAGAVAGSSVGAIVGHSLTSYGSGPGALVGLGIGAAGGAIAAERIYGPDETAELAAAQGEVERLNAQVAARDKELRDTKDAVAREQAQQKALLEAYDKSRQTAAAGPAPAVVAEARPSLAINAGPNVQVAADAEGVKYTILSGVLFASGKAALSTEGKATLKKAALSIREQFPNAYIEVRGHTDNEPIRYSSYKTNQALSDARAQAVLRYLVDAEGFSADRLTPAGFADMRPVAPNTTASGRAKNRRAEIVVRTDNVQVADSISAF